ncbi:ABC transporter ATP-binding protein [Chromohalobacter japonicus]|uniref:ABC transporter ATP-binding protein n=1 Tax=Chromohalobacter japonicus TaxID=223900 RepID=UPI00058BF2F6|nr:ABC transporter ATP-binding protein [Chromohalobacter japonicus]
MSSDMEYALRVRRLRKDFRLYPSNGARLRQWLWHPISRRLGRPLPPAYQTFTALDELSFDVQRGQTVGVIGRNGSGKSTLLQLLSGTLTPTQGEVEVNGRVAALLELGSGFNPEFSGRENVYIYAAIMGLSRKQVDERFVSIEAFAEIGEFIDRPVKSYSSGMMVRLAFAVIVHVDADILIIDEALSVGDAFFVQKCMRFLRGFMAHGTVFFVSHDSSAVTNLCDQALWLEHGRLRMVGTAKEVTEHYLASQFETTNEARVDEDASDVAEDEAFLIEEDYHDMRRDLVMNSTLRNDLEVFRFDPHGSDFGEGGGEIRHAALYDEHGRALSWLVGGEAVELVVQARAQRVLDGPILGFYLKDRLGQALFGDNTYIGTERLHLSPGEVFTARFAFRMPVLPRGQYSLAIALAEGTQEDHVQHHWLHDALLLESHASHVASGLVGIPMRHIRLERRERASADDAPEDSR